MKRKIVVSFNFRVKLVMNNIKKYTERYSDSIARTPIGLALRLLDNALPTNIPDVQIWSEDTETLHLIWPGIEVTLIQDDKKGVSALCECTKQLFQLHEGLDSIRSLAEHIAVHVHYRASRPSEAYESPRKFSI